MRVQLEKRGVLGAGQVKKGGSLPRHIPILNIYVSTPPPPGVKHLTDFPTPHFQTPDWQVQCRSVLTEIYGHLCLTDLEIKTALINSGPRPFTLHCSTPWGGGIA